MKITNKFYNYTNFFLFCLIILFACCFFFINNEQEHFDFRINKNRSTTQGQNTNFKNVPISKPQPQQKITNNKSSKKRGNKIIINNKNVIKGDNNPPFYDYDNFYTYGTYPYPLTSYFYPSQSYFNPYFNNSFNPYFNNSFNNDFISDYRDYYNSGSRNTVNGNFVDFNNPGYEPVYPDWCWSFIGYKDANLVPMASRMQWYNWAKKYNIDSMLVPRDRSDFALIPSTGGNCYIDKFGDHSMFDKILIN